jgi:metallo-beta-lactamase family protein
MAPAATLRFLGAAGTVTGSRFLLSTPRARVLVDCGLFQGHKALRLRNWEPFPCPEGLHAVVLTHAHVDHCGYLPALVRAGYRGPVFATRGTAELAAIVLPDSGRLQEEDASFANREGFSKHDPALPLYTEEDARAAAEAIVPVAAGEEREIAPGVRLVLRRAGHILGAASATLVLEGPPERRLVVSGDLGRPAHPLLCAPEPPDAADWLLVESTYGDREHHDEHVADALAEAVRETARRGGVVVIPAFAVDRTENVLFQLRELAASGRIPRLPVYVDSPMALAALRVYRRALAEGWDEVRPELRGHDEALDPGGLEEVRDPRASRALCEAPGPFVVSASGMATGGRVLHHLPRASRSATALLVGFRARYARPSSAVGRAQREDARTLRARACPDPGSVGLLGTCRLERAGGLARERAAAAACGLRRARRRPPPRPSRHSGPRPAGRSWRRATAR